MFLPPKRNLQNHCFQFLLGGTSRLKRNRRQWLCTFFFWGGGGGAKQGAVWSIMRKWGTPSGINAFDVRRTQPKLNQHEAWARTFWTKKLYFYAWVKYRKRKFITDFSFPRALRLLKITSAPGKKCFDREYLFKWQERWNNEHDNIKKLFPFVTISKKANVYGTWTFCLTLTTFVDNVHKIINANEDWFSWLICCKCCFILSNDCHFR